MTGAELKTLNTEILDGREMGDTLFFQLANIARVRREGLRDWVKLRVEDSSKTLSSGDTYQTAKALPTDFSKPLISRFGSDDSRAPIFLVSSDNSIVPLIEIPMSQKYTYKDTFGYFYVDYANGNYYITGRADKTYTIHFFYIKDSGDIVSGDDPAWAPFSKYVAVLAYDVAAMQKGGIDYDDRNAQMSPDNRAQAEALWAAAVLEDDKLQRSMLGV